MNLERLTEILDAEFSVTKCQEDIVGWSVTSENKPLLNPAFLEKQSGLFLKSSVTVEKVYTAVFITDYIVEKISRQKGNNLIFTHHHFNYHEDHRGLVPTSASTLNKLKQNLTSIFVAHGPLDHHKKYGTSISLAKLISLEVDHMFFDYFGEPVALVAHVEKTPFDSFAENVRQRLGRPVLTLENNNGFVEKIAIAAGGGDMADILQEAKDLGADTYLTGTIEHRWDHPLIRENNTKFHELNKHLKLNLIDGTHFGTERPAMISVVEYFKDIEIDTEYCEDEVLLHAI